MRYCKLASLVVLVYSGASMADGIKWGYDKASSPPHWGAISPHFSLCETGKNQSPIDIKNSIKTAHSALALTFIEQMPQYITNNGHTIQVNLMQSGNTLTLDDEVFNLQQYHFHAPSEHQIKDKILPMEMHFVYRDKAGEIAVLALMFKEGKENTELAKAWQQLPVKQGQRWALKAPVNIQALLPHGFNYYRYSGSLTTPPCTEGVIWLIIDKFVEISPAQLKQFRTIYHDNNRPIQPLHGRVIVD